MSILYDMSDSFAMLCIVVLFGSSTFFRKLAVDGMSPYHLQILSGLIYASLIPLWFRVGGSFEFPSLRFIFAGTLAIITNVTGAVIFGFLLKESTNMTVLSAVASASPVVTAVLSATFLGERFTLLKLVGVLLVLCGVLLINR